MNWQVTYRGRDGKQGVEEFEAVSREALFAALKAKGINAIKVAESMPGKRSQRTAILPRGATLAGSPARPVRRAIVWTIIGVALAITAWFIAIREGASSKNGSVGARRPSRLALNETASPSHTPSFEDDAPANAQPVISTPTKQAEAVTPTKESATNEVSEAEAARIQKWKDKFAKRKSIFNNASDQILGMIAGAPPGRDMPPLPIAKSIDRDFMKSLETPIVINDEDSDRVKELKKSVMRLRDEILEIKKSEGLSVYEILTQHQDLVRENAAIRVNAQREALEIYNSGDVEAAQEYVDKMNEALDRLGAEAIRLPGEPDEAMRQHMRDRLQAIRERKKGNKQR